MNMYNPGITYNVNTKENNNPPTMAIPIGTLLVAASPRANAIGIAPKAVAKVVIKIGLNRLTEALMIDSITDKPSCLC